MWYSLSDISNIVKTWMSIINPAAWLAGYLGEKVGNKLKDYVNPTYSTEQLTQGNRYSTSWLANLLNSESTVQRNEQINKQLDNIANKHTVRMNIANWNISSWNKGVDKMEQARSSLSDYARIAYLNEAQKDSSMDLSKMEKMKDQDIINWLIEWDDNAKKTYLDFVNNGWVVWDVYNSIMGINPNEEKEREKEDSSWLKNYAWAALYEVPKQVWGLFDIMWVTDLINNREKKEMEVYHNLSTDEYNKFMNWQINYEDLGRKSWIYNDYKRALDRGQFVGSVEDFGNVMYNKRIWETDKTAQQKVRDWSILNYNEEWDWAWAWEMTTKALEFYFLPWGWWGFFKNLLVWTAEMLWIDALSQWKLPTPWDAWLTTAANTVLEAVTRSPAAVKAIQKALAWVTPEIKKALWETTVEQFKKFSDIASQWFEATKKYATWLLDKAAGWLKKKLWEESTRLKNIRQNMKWNYTYDDYFNAINEKFKEFEKEWWDKNAVPEIKINPKSWELEIYNEEALSNITDTNWQKLTDMIKSEWEAYRNQWRKWDIRDVENLMKNMEQKIYNAVKSGWIKSSDSAVKAFLEWTKDAYEWLYKAMWWEWTIFKNSRERFNKFSNYEEFFDKYIWNIKLWNKPLDQLEKTTRWEKSMWKGSNAIWDFLSLLKDEHIVDEDLKSQLISLIYTFWIKDPKKVQKLLEWIYPSVPWMYEVWLEFGRQWAKESYAKTLLKDAKQPNGIRWDIARSIWKSGLTELE